MGVILQLGLLTWERAHGIVNKQMLAPFLAHSIKECCGGNREVYEGYAFAFGNGTGNSGVVAMSGLCLAVLEVAAFGCRQVIEEETKRGFRVKLII